MEYKKAVEMVRNNWFKEHEATFNKLTKDISVLDWQKPGTIIYRIRYVFDRNSIYITGDCGEAIFVLTESADLRKLCKYDIQYFIGKLKCFCDDVYNFDSTKAVARLNEWRRDLREGAYDRSLDDLIDNLIEDTETCCVETHWRGVLLRHYDDISEYDSDAFEWLPSIGNEINNRLIGYLEGIKMAYEQLADTLPQASLMDDVNFYTQFIGALAHQHEDAIECDECTGVYRESWFNGKCPYCQVTHEGVIAIEVNNG